MSYLVAVGAMLSLGVGLWCINNKEAMPYELTSPNIPGDSNDRLQNAMKTTGLNNPRSDIHVDSLTNKINQSFAGVDPQRHKMAYKNPKDFDGDASWVTTLGETVESSNLQNEEQLIGSLRECLKPDRMDQLKGVPHRGVSGEPEFF